MSKSSRNTADKRAKSTIEKTDRDYETTTIAQDGIAGWARGLTHNLRAYVLVVSILIALGFYYQITSTISAETTRLAELTRAYALLSVLYLYVALIITPLFKRFPKLRGQGKYKFMRRGIGVSAFGFAALHSYVSFFGQFGGFAGLKFLSGRYQLAIALGGLALLILFVTAAISFDWAIRKLSFKWWKRLQRFVYLASLATIIHTLMLGTHFNTIQGLIPILSLIALIFLAFLEAPRLDAFFGQWRLTQDRLGLGSVGLLILLVAIAGFGYGASRSGSGAGLSVHSAHEATSTTATPFGTPVAPTGAGSLYNANLNLGDPVAADTPLPVQFEIFNVTNGNRVADLLPTGNDRAQISVVDNTLSTVRVVHLSLTGSVLSGTIPALPSGLYRLYLRFQPSDSTTQQLASTLTVGEVVSPSFTDDQPDGQQTKQFGDIKATISDTTLSATRLNTGQQTLTLSISNADGSPYSGSTGPVMLINEDTYVSLHSYLLGTNDPGTPKNIIKFTPTALYGTIATGTYKLLVPLGDTGQTISFTLGVNL